MLVVRSSLVTAYAAALGTTVWATFLALDRSPRSDLPLAKEPTAAQPVVPEGEWRAWARRQAGLLERVEALMKAQPTRPADVAPAPSSAPSATEATQTAWWPPEPALKPVEWSDDRSQLVAYNVTEESAQPSPSAATESFWSRFLTLLEPASASTMAGGGKAERQRKVAADARLGLGKAPRSAAADRLAPARAMTLRAIPARRAIRTSGATAAPATTAARTATEARTTARA